MSVFVRGEVGGLLRGGGVGGYVCWCVSVVSVCGCVSVCGGGTPGGPRVPRAIPEKRKESA